MCKVSLRCEKCLNEQTLSNQAVQVLVVWSFNAQVAATNVVDGLVVNHEAAVTVLQCGVGGQDGVVWFDNRRRNLRSRVDTEFEFALFSIVNRETLHEQSTETRASAATKGVENKEALKTRAVVCDASDLVEDLVNQFFADSVVPTSIVVGRILLASNHMFRVKQLTVGTGANFVDNIGFQIAIDGAWNVFALA